MEAVNRPRTDTDEQRREDSILEAMLFRKQGRECANDNDNDILAIGLAIQTLGNEGEKTARASPKP